jgi:hypothetical protein
MGRPINNNYIGNVNTAGYVITGQAWVAGDSQPRPSYIVKQRGSTSYVMAPIAGNGVTAGGQVYLVDGPILQAGQGNISVTPFGAIGSGAVGNANVGVTGATVTNSGAFSTTTSYKPGEILHLAGGTYTGNAQANVVVDAVTIRTFGVQAGGTNYTLGDYFLFSGSGYNQSANLVVTAVSGAVVTNVTIISSGQYTGTTLPPNAVTPTSQTVTNTNASGATFNFGWGISIISPVNEGDYSAAPSSPAAVTGSANGTGATITPTYSVSSLYVKATGSGYNGSPIVEFSSGAAAAVSVVNAAGYVTGLTLLDAGANYVGNPNVFIVDTGTTFNLAKLTDSLAYTFNGNSYKWVLTGVPLQGPTFATIQSQ